MEKFDSSGDFRMRKFKRLMQLELQGLGNVLNEEVVKDTKVEEHSISKTEEVAKKNPLTKEKDTQARNLICLSLTNMVISLKLP